MNAKQKIHQTNLAKWSDLFRDQQTSGLTIKDWCAQNSISQHAYYYWKRIAKEAYVNSIIPDIVPLPAEQHSELPMVQPSAELNLYNSCKSSKTSDPVIISMGDIRIEIGASASDEMISGIIKAVRHA